MLNISFNRSLKFYPPSCLLCSWTGGQGQGWWCWGPLERPWVSPPAPPSSLVAPSHRWRKLVHNRNAVVFFSLKLVIFCRKFTLPFMLPLRAVSPPPGTVLLFWFRSSFRQHFYNRILLGFVWDFLQYVVHVVEILSLALLQYVKFFPSSHIHISYVSSSPLVHVQYV